MIESIPNFNQAELESVTMESHLSLTLWLGKSEPGTQNHQIPYHMKTGTLFLANNLPNTFLDGSYLMNVDDSYGVSSFSINFRCVAALDGAVASLMVAVAEDFKLLSRERRLAPTDWPFLRPKRSIVEKKAYFRYNRQIEKLRRN